jgi:hypothetical protein
METTAQVECKRIGNPLQLLNNQHPAPTKLECCGPQHSGMRILFWPSGVLRPATPLTFQMLRHPAPAPCNKSPSHGPRINCCRQFAHFAAWVHLLTKEYLHHG